MPTTPARSQHSTNAQHAPYVYRTSTCCVRLTRDPASTAAQARCVGIDRSKKREDRSRVSAADTDLTPQSFSEDWVNDTKTTLHWGKRSRLTPCCTARPNWRQGGQSPAAMAPRRDASVENATRWTLFPRPKTQGPPVETGPGSQISGNRATWGSPKIHWLDAARVGASAQEQIHWQTVVPLQITALRRHSWQKVNVTSGYLRGKHTASCVVKGCRMRVMVGTRFCDATTIHRRVGAVTVNHCHQFQRVHGFRSTLGSRALPPPADTSSIRDSVRWHVITAYERR